MLRILHTADWHLGQLFHGYERDHEHEAFLQWLLRTLAERRTDVLLISGDVYDSINPPATAQRRFFRFLAHAHLASPNLQVVMIAGNHDAAARLEAPASLLEHVKATVVGTVERGADGEIAPDKFLVPLRNASGEVRAIAVAVPFLRPSDVPAVPEAADPHLDGVRELYRLAVAVAEKLRDSQFPGAALIALGHCHLQDAVESRDSERRLVIGGEQSLHVDTFAPCLAYVALGHLHKPQDLAGGRIHYCGSPIPLSFSEKDYEHRVLEITLDGDAPPQILPLAIPHTATLLRLPAEGPRPIAEVLAALELAHFDPALPPEAQPYLEVRVLSEGPDPTRRQRIADALEGKPVRLASIKVELPARAEPRATLPVEASPSLGALRPEDVLLSYYRERYQAEPAPEVMDAFREILREHLASPVPEAA